MLCPVPNRGIADSNRNRRGRQIKADRCLPDERNHFRRQQAEMRPPLVLVVWRALTVAPDGMPEEPIVLPDVPALLPPPRCPIHDDTAELLQVVLGVQLGCV